MIELTGQYTDCKIFTDYVEEIALSQVYGFLNHPAFEGKQTRFMPDIHAGSGAVIGTTVEMGDFVIPNIVGVDIGCGMLSYKIMTKDIDYEALDNFIRDEIPSGFNISNRIQTKDHNILKRIDEVCKEIDISSNRAKLSLGTLGGGNHFIEVGRDEQNNLWITVHSGSRNLGLQIAKYHQKIAENYSLASISKEEMEEKIAEIKKTKKGKQIQVEIEKLKKRSQVRKHKRNGLEYLQGDLADKYIEHMKVAQDYASLNRSLMIDKIISFLGTFVVDHVESIHNYIDFNDGIIRKGAISAHKDEMVIIPWNMRDGLIIGRGKGNPDWNYSAPHGAGRVMSRGKAKEKVSLKEFKESMEGIYSTSVNQSTVDESPMAYKDHTEVEKYLEESVEIIHRVKPEYNFKA